MNKVSKILLIEDDTTFSKIVSTFLAKKGFEIDCVTTLKSGKVNLRTIEYDLLLLDYRLPDGNGLELIEIFRKELPRIPTIIITSFNDVRTAVKSIQSGAFEYITKPVNPDELMMVIQSALSRKTAEASEKSIEASFIKGESAAAVRLYELVGLVAPTEMSVMIIGESGTGKEHVARAIHDQSKRANMPFVAVDCGVLSKELASSELFGHVKGAFTGALNDQSGLLERANGGTLFLDEIGNLSYDVQVKLLRTLQERVIQPVGSPKTISVDIRLITATNENLLEEIARGNFREDIYHRINEFKIQLPPLRERGADLELFTKHFVQMANNELNRSIKSVSEEVLNLFYRYDWPGNLRELKNVIKRMVLLAKEEEAGIDVLPEEMWMNIGARTGSNDLKAAKEESEKEHIQNALSLAKYNKSKAAKLLNIDRKTLYNKMEKYNLD